MASKRKTGENSPSARVSRRAATRKHEETQSADKVSASSSNKRKQPDSNNNTELNVEAPAKKIKITQTATSATTPATSPLTPAVLPTAAPTTKPIRRLVPQGPRRTATVGVKDESLLRMVCHCANTNTTNELHFRKIPASAIRWTSPHHIRKINAWRNQIYGRAGIKARSVNQWHEYEELWLELYFQLSIAEALKRPTVVPNTALIRRAFNDMFVGRVLYAHDGVALAPREERRGNAFSSKFGRVCHRLRARLAACVLGKSGDVYMPRITMDMVHEYKGMKMLLEDMGIYAESEYAEGLEAWRGFLASLPVGDEEEEEEEVGDEEETVIDDEATISAVDEDDYYDGLWRGSQCDMDDEDKDMALQKKEEDAVVALWRLSRAAVVYNGFVEFVPDNNNNNNNDTRTAFPGAPVHVHAYKTRMSSSTAYATSNIPVRGIGTGSSMGFYNPANASITWTDSAATLTAYPLTTSYMHCM
ncbi:hypothetical protein ACJBU6_03362 [Exserohilum turcicum]